MPPLPHPAPRTLSLDARLRSLLLLLLVLFNALLAAAANSADDPPLTAILSSWSPAIPIGKSYIIPSAIVTTTASPSNTESAAQNTEAGVAPKSVFLCDSSDAAVLPSTYEQMVQKTTAAIVTLSSLIAYVTINSLVRAVYPAAFVWNEEDLDEKTWIASSHHWLDRKACRWFGICGVAHYHPVHPRFGHRKAGSMSDPDEEGGSIWRNDWRNETDNPEHAWDQAEKSRRQIPDYVLEYAPLVHLFSDEQFWPGDIAEHLYHTTPNLNYTPIQSQSDHPTLRDLDQLNQWEGGHHVFLTSNDNVEDRPHWIEGERNVPSPPKDDLETSWADWDGRVDGAFPDDTPENRVEWFNSQLPLHDRKLEDISPDELGYPVSDEEVHDELRKRYGGEPLSVKEVGGRSEAPAILLVVDKGNGIVDAFWFFFYSFNLGNVVLNVRFGNHVGDWEHCLVRFHHGKPKALFFSAHTGGEAYSYEAVEKIGRRVSLHLYIVFKNAWALIAGRNPSRLYTQQQGRMPCMLLLECMHTFSHGAFSMMRQIEVLFGIRFSTPTRIRMTILMTNFALQPSTRPRQLSGFTSAAIGETNSILWVTADNIALPASITM